MKFSHFKILSVIIFIIVFNIYGQTKTSVNCDSLQTDYLSTIKEWRTIFKEITSDAITEKQYDSLLICYKQKWKKANLGQIKFINCKHPLIKLTKEEYEIPPLIPTYKNKSKLDESNALNQLCFNLKLSNSSYQSSYSECERRLNSYDYFTINDYDSLKSYAFYFIGEALKFGKYYTECSADSMFDANFQTKIKSLPVPPFEVDQNYYEGKHEYFHSVEIADESIEEMKNFLLQNFPQEALSEGVSGKVRFCFRLGSNGEPCDIKILSEKPPFFGFSEITEQAVILLKQKSAETENIHTEMMGSVNYKSFDDRKIDKRIELEIKPFYSGKVFFH